MKHLAYIVACIVAIGAQPLFADQAKPADSKATEVKSAGAKPTAPSDSKTTGSAEKPKAGPVAVNNTKCPVSGEPIGSMGEGVTVTYKNHEVKLCCDGCTKKFNKEPEKYLSKAMESAKK
ncbi:MAG: hypothetical protein K1X53_02230 [Candidatus Sumerlaeaceae bacterium]|nr:hypothetical protein [Candidatus Sumerlaeaceae bacterium]